MMRAQLRAFHWVPPLAPGVAGRRQQLEIPKWLN